MCREGILGGMDSVDDEPTCGGERVVGRGG